VNHVSESFGVPGRVDQPTVARRGLRKRICVGCRWYPLSRSSARIQRNDRSNGMPRRALTASAPRAALGRLPGLGKQGANEGDLFAVSTWPDMNDADFRAGGSFPHRKTLA